MRMVANEAPFNTKVFLDGVERTYVIEADEEARYIIRAKTDESGKVHFNIEKDEYDVETLRGDVLIRFPPGFEAFEKLMREKR